MAATRTDQQISPASWQLLHQFAKFVFSTAMSALLNYLPLSKKEERHPLPDTVESDDIIPVHLFDDTAAARGIVLVWTLQFEDVLNPHKLSDALSKLFEMEGWRRLGGRFRQRVCSHGSKKFLDIDPHTARWRTRNTCSTRIYKRQASSLFHQRRV